EIAVHEGRYRQVRRMCEAVGLTVLGLHRSAYGSLKLAPLARGMWRELSEAEVAELREGSARPHARPRGRGTGEYFSARRGIVRSVRAKTVAPAHRASVRAVRARIVAPAHRANVRSVRARIVAPAHRANVRIVRARIVAPARRASGRSARARNVAPARRAS